MTTPEPEQLDEAIERAYVKLRFQQRSEQEILDELKALARLGEIDCHNTVIKAAQWFLRRDAIEYANKGNLDFFQLLEQTAVALDTLLKE